MTDANEICRMDTVTLAGRIKAKELSPVEVVEAVLGRLERLDLSRPKIGFGSSPASPPGVRRRACTR
jgi:Asp-tRNA(Asn)/Glu-tRNA(Gln) amidotransferase A subunit family amidase